MPSDEMKVFLVTTMYGLAGPETRRIEATGYVNEDGFTTFTDAAGAQVFTARNDSLRSVELVRGAQPPLSTILDLIGVARETGSASGSVFFAKMSDFPGGPLYRPGYDITVVSIAEKTADPSGNGERAAEAGMVSSSTSVR